MDGFEDEKYLIRIRNNQIRGILNQEPISKMVDRRELIWFWAPNYEG
jgi:hypothetical protein